MTDPAVIDALKAARELWIHRGRDQFILLGRALLLLPADVVLAMGEPQDPPQIEDEECDSEERPDSEPSSLR